MVETTPAIPSFEKLPSTFLVQLTRLDPVLFHFSYYFLGTETGELKVPMDHVQYISMNDVCVYIYTDLVHGVSSTGFCQRNCLLHL